jgi:hypothetical protein
MTQLEKDFKIKVGTTMANMNGTDFEYMCKHIFESLIKKESVHKGHTTQGKPAGYTADFYDTQLINIGQCGTDEDYFAGFEKDNKGVRKKKSEDEKPIKDYLKAAERYPDSEKVYIFSNRYATGNKYAEAVKEAKKLIVQKSLKPSFVLFDAQQIIELIYKRSISENKIADVIVNYFPEAYELYKLFPSTNAIPFFRSKTYYPRKEENEVIEILKNVDFLQIYGLSGIGKSELSIRIANILIPKYEVVLWIDAEESNFTDISFKSVKILKFDTPINLSHFLEKYKCLLVVDNLNIGTQNTLRQFELFNKMGSKCIITSLIKSVGEKNSYNLSFLNDSIALKILNNVQPRPAVTEAKQIIKVVGGYPILLAILASNIENNSLSWKEMSDELSHLKELHDDTRGTIIAKRIIEKIKKIFNKELSLLKYLSSNKISKEFLLKALGNTVLTKFKSSSIIKSNDLNHYSIHQIVLESINYEVNNESYETEFDEVLKDYLSQNNEIKSFGYYDFIFTHSDFLTKKLAKTSDNYLKKIIIYCKTQALDYKTHSSDIIELINSVDISKEDYYSLSLLIEKYEIRRSTLFEEYFRKETDSQLATLLSIENRVKEPIIHTMLCHHIGKIYFSRLSKLKNTEDAQNATSWFKNVLNDNITADYALLQLAKLSIKTNTLDYEQYIRKAFNASEMSLTVLISFYEILFQSKFEKLRLELIDSDILKFRDNMLRSINANFDQPYTLLAKISDTLSYLHEDVFLNLAEAIPCPANINSNSQLKFSYAKIQSVLYKHLRGNNTNTVESDKLLSIKNICLEYFEPNSFNQFQLKEYCKFLLYIGENTNALSKCNLLQDTDPFSCQMKAKIYFANGLFESALSSIENSLLIAESKGIADGFKAAFFNDKAEALHALRRDNSTDILRQAIKLQNNHKAKSQWEDKLLEWEREL